MEDVNKRRRNFLSLSKLEYSPQEINSREICGEKQTNKQINKREKLQENFRMRWSISIFLFVMSHTIENASNKKYNERANEFLVYYEYSLR